MPLSDRAAYQWEPGPLAPPSGAYSGPRLLSVTLVGTLSRRTRAHVRRER